MFTTTYFELAKSGRCGQEKRIFYHETQFCQLNLKIHHLLCIGEVAIYAINWFMQTANHKRKSARLFHALFQMVAINAEDAYSATI
jgi:hypothetical protein